MNTIKRSDVSPLKERGGKRKIYHNESIWVRETLNIDVIMKKARDFYPNAYSLEERKEMQIKIGLQDYYSTGRIEKTRRKVQNKNECQQKTKPK